jgi:hypothetical protein
VFNPIRSHKHLSPSKKRHRHYCLDAWKGCCNKNPSIINRRTSKERKENDACHNRDISRGIGVSDSSSRNSLLLLKVGLDMFKFYASRTRFCQGMLASMEMHARHDLLSKLVACFFLSLLQQLFGINTWW